MSKEEVEEYKKGCEGSRELWKKSLLKTIYKKIDCFSSIYEELDNLGLDTENDPDRLIIESIRNLVLNKIIPSFLSCRFSYSLYKIDNTLLPNFIYQIHMMVLERIKFLVAFVYYHFNVRQGAVEYFKDVKTMLDFLDIFPEKNYEQFIGKKQNIFKFKDEIEEYIWLNNCCEIINSLKDSDQISSKLYLVSLYRTIVDFEKSLKLIDELKKDKNIIKEKDYRRFLKYSEIACKVGNRELFLY